MTTCFNLNSFFFFAYPMKTGGSLAVCPSPVTMATWILAPVALARDGVKGWGRGMSSLTPESLTVLLGCIHI